MCKRLHHRNIINKLGLGTSKKLFQYLCNQQLKTQNDRTHTSDNEGHCSRVWH